MVEAFEISFKHSHTNFVQDSMVGYAKKYIYLNVLLFALKMAVLSVF